MTRGEGAAHAGIGGDTLLTVTATPLDATEEEVAAFREASGSMEAGWGQTPDALGRFLADAPEGTDRR